MIQKELTTGDTAPVIFSRFRDEAGSLITTDQVSGVTFSLRLRGAAEAAVADAACSILSSGEEPLICQWSPGDDDLATAGTYDAELQITYLSGKVKHYPEKAGQFIVIVRSNLA